MENPCIASPVKLPKYRFRPRKYDPSLYIVHSTRGPQPPENQVDASIGWFNSTASGSYKQGWGSIADFIIGEYPPHSGEIVIVQLNPLPFSQHAAWATGYGRLGPGEEYGADECGFAVEHQQSSREERYPDAIYEKSAELYRWLNYNLNKQGKPIISTDFIEHWDQLLSEPVPNGMLGHENTLNGVKLHKTDPGDRWDWNKFRHYCRTGRPSIVPASAGAATGLDRIAALERRVGAIEQELRDLGKRF